MSLLLDQSLSSKSTHVITRNYFSNLDFRELISLLLDQRLIRYHKHLSHLIRFYSLPMNLDINISLTNDDHDRNYAVPHNIIFSFDDTTTTCPSFQWRNSSQVKGG